MSKAHVDPADLRRFAQDLNRFNNDLQTLLGGLHAKLRALELAGNLIGRVAGPGDLSTNPKYFEGFGK